MALACPLGIALLLTLLVASDARAQVNAELLQRSPLDPGWSGLVQASFSLSYGNVDLIDLGATAQTRFQTLHEPEEGDDPDVPPWLAHRWLLRGDGRFAEKDGAPIVSQAFVHTRWAGMWHRRVGSEVFAQLQYDKFWRLQLRALAGAGVRVEVVHTAPFLLSLGTDYMLELERIDVPEGAPDDAETLAHRWSSYLSARLALFEDSLLLQSTLYAQPRLDRFHDYRVLEELELVVGVTNWLSFGTTLSVLHDSEPPTGVEDTDVRLTSNVRFSL